VVAWLLVAIVLLFCAWRFSATSEMLAVTTAGNARMLEKQEENQRQLAEILREIRTARTTIPQAVKEQAKDVARDVVDDVVKDLFKAKKAGGQAPDR
jgi:hypothetical protein